MTLAEASRQYQIAMEHERRGRTELGHVLSAQDELEHAARETDHARERVLDLMVTRARG